MATPKIKSKAVLLGFDPESKCVYSQILELSDYYDREHVWDKGSRVKALRLHRVKGYLFDSAGVLDQEFESIFDVNTGKLTAAEARHADGTIKRLGT
jgi:hypothetical protein